jgi:hypothetical protein
MSWDSSVGIAMGYRLDGQGSIPGSGKIFLLSLASWTALGLTQLPIKWVLEDLSMGAQWPRHEADHSPASRAEGKNGGAIPPLPNMSS